jgi:ATP/ADP translocase
MEGLKTTALIIPFIALITVIILFVHLLKQSHNRGAFKRLTYLIIASSFLLNFAWEMLQMPLYKGMTLNMQTATFCGVASIADVIMVMLLYYAFAVIYKDAFWAQHFTPLRILLLLLVGAVGAILAEMLHLANGNWKYSQRMPIIPIGNVGLSPFLQFIILPILSYRISSYFTKLIGHRNNAVTDSQ